MSVSCVKALGHMDHILCKVGDSQHGDPDFMEVEGVVWTLC